MAALEKRCKLHLAQAWSNRAPKGRKTDFKDAQQRQLRTLTRRRVQLSQDRVRLQNQLEALLEQMRIKLSSVVTDLLGASEQKILAAIAKGEDNPEKLAALAMLG